MKYTLYQAGYAHFVEVLAQKTAKEGTRYFKEFELLKGESIAHINSDKGSRPNGTPWPKKVGDIFLFKNTVEDYVTYLVVIDELDDSKNKVYIVNEAHDGIAPTAEELACFEDIRQMAGVWADDIMARIASLIQFGWYGFFGEVGDKSVPQRSNMLAEYTWFCQDEKKTMVKAGVHSVGREFVVAIASGSDYKQFNFIYEPREAEDFSGVMESLGVMFGDYNSELTATDQDNYYRGLEGWFEHSIKGDTACYKGVLNHLFNWSLEAMGSKNKLLCVVTEN